METRTPLLSVIIPAYNAAATLSEQLHSLTKQTYSGPWEVIVSDNRSSDNTAEVVHAFGESLPNLQHVLAAEKQGRSYACNYGAQQANGDILVFCDADDVAAPDWLAQLAPHTTHSDIVAGITEVELLNEDAPWRPAPFVSSSKPVLNFLPYAIGANLAVRRDVFEDLDGFTEDIPPCEDIDFTWRAQLAGYRIKDAPNAIIHYRYRDTACSFWKQITGYAEAHSFLYSRFKHHGMPRTDFHQVLRTYRWLVAEGLRWPQASVKDRSRWLYKLAGVWGHLRGSVRYRTLYL